MRHILPSSVVEWPAPFDPMVELDWGGHDVSRRLLFEHLDQSHDGASRRAAGIDTHVRRLNRLLPSPPARVLDAGCGPGLYSLRLGRAGYDVSGVDVGAAVLAHGRRAAKAAGVHVDFQRQDLRALDLHRRFDAALLIYYVLDGFSRRDQTRVLRRIARHLNPGGLLIAELRVRPDQPPGRLTRWDVVPRSLVSETPHLLLVDTTYDDRGNTFVLREIAVLDDGSVVTQQTTNRLFALDEVPRLFERSGFRVRSVYDGWTRFHANALSESLLVAAHRM